MCPVSAVPPYIPPYDPLSANLPMIPLLPTPSEIRNSIINNEMRTYYILWKSLALLSYQAQLATCLTREDSTIPGWTLEMTANLIETKRTGKGERTPFARLATRDNASNSSLKDVLISVRGTMVSLPIL